MAVDTPARIAILGAGPIGLEAALYARFLGYDVELYERTTPAHHVLQWGHVRMFTPFSMNCSPLGRAALAAQDDDYRPPADDQLLTGREWAEHYLLPLASTDLLADHLHLEREVVAVSRQDFRKTDLPGEQQRDESPFRILTRDSSGREFVSEAEIVIDTTGVFGNANWMGRGGIPAPGELGLRGHFEYGLPDVRGTRRESFSGRHTLVVGDGYSAATTVVALAELQREVPETRITWITRRGRSGAAAGPLVRVPDDRLPQRDRLADEANRLASEPPAGFVWLPGASIESVALAGGGEEAEANAVGKPSGDLPPEPQGGFVVTLAAAPNEDSDGSDAPPPGAGRPPLAKDPAVAGPLIARPLIARPLIVDQIVANVGYRPDWEPLRELQLHTCYASEGPIKLAAALLGKPTADCLEAGGLGVETLRNPEPNLYVLGSKSYGRNSNFLFAEGLEQIRRLFALIGDRENLDLYAGARSLPQ